MKYLFFCTILPMVLVVGILTAVKGVKVEPKNSQHLSPRCCFIDEEGKTHLSGVCSKIGMTCPI